MPDPTGRGGAPPEKRDGSHQGEPEPRIISNNKASIDWFYISIISRRTPLKLVSTVDGERLGRRRPYLVRPARVDDLAVRRRPWAVEGLWIAFYPPSRNGGWYRPIQVVTGGKGRKP